MDIKTKTTTTVDFSVKDLEQLLIDILTSTGKINQGVTRIETIFEPGVYDYDDRYPSPDVFKGIRVINEK